MKKNIITINRDIWKTPTEIVNEFPKRLTTQVISMAIKRKKLRVWRPEGLRITLVNRADALKLYGAND